MALTINVFGSTKIDETTGLQDNDVALADVPSNVSTAFSNAGVNLASAIQIAGGGTDDLTVTPDSGFTVNGLGFVDETNGALDGDASGLLTLEGRQIFLYADPNNDNVVLGREGTVGGLADPSGAIVFAVYLEETTTNSLITGGKFWTVLFEPLKHTDANLYDFTVNLDNHLKVAAIQSTTFSFDNAPSGANEFMMFGNNPAGVSTSGIVVTGRSPDPNTEDSDHSGDTVSSSQAGPHATIGVNGQHLAPGNGMNFTFVDNPAEDFTVAPNPDPHLPEGLSATEADHEGNIQFTGYTTGVTSASFTVAQVNPTGNVVTVKISAFNDPDGATGETGTGFVDGFGDDAPVNITEVKINGVVVNNADLNGDTAVISGVKNGDVVSYTTTSAHTRVLIENVQPVKGAGSNITLDIGGFTILSSQAASAFAGTQIQFDDDGPTITASATNAPTLTVDETTLATDATGSFAGQFTKNFGTDGAAGSNSVTYALSTPGGASGLTDTATGESVVLSLVGGQILGKTQTTGLTVFVVSVDASGQVTLDQKRAVVHANPNDPNESRGLTGSNLVVLTATATDGDGDHASAPLDLTSLLAFKDDGPAITASATGATTLTVDETTLATDATGSFAAQFTPTFGADGQGATPVSYALSTPGGASGLTDTATGESVVLSLVGGQILGKTQTTGLTVFVVSVDASGQVTLDQKRAVVHANPNDPNESRGLTGSNLVVLTATATDGDGDHASAPLDLTPLLAFKDDGPAITASATGATTLTVDETTLATDATGSFAAQFTPTFGADGQGATPVSYALSTPGGASGLTDTATGESVVLSLVGGQILGKTQTTGLTVFVVSVDASGQVTLDQKRAVVHANPNDPNESRGLTGSNLVVLTATATDGDGDHASAPLDLTPLLAFKDDGPSITVHNITNGTYAAGGGSTWPEGPGADGFKSLNITLNNYTIDAHSTVTVNTSLGTATTTDVNGNYVFNGTINADFNGDGISDSVAFTLAFKPVADTYTISVTTPPPSIVNFDTSQGSLAPGGPDPVQQLNFSSGPATGERVVFFGAVPTGPATNGSQNDGTHTPPQDFLDLVKLGQQDLTKAQIDALLGPPNQIPAALINSSTQMNVSTSGIGINNNNLDGSGANIQSTDESFVVNPSQLVDKVKVFIDNSVGGYNPGTEDLEYRVYYSDGTVSAYAKVKDTDLTPVTSGVANGGKSFEISDVAGGPQIDAVQLTMANGTIKIPVIQFSIQQSFLPEPLNMNLTATLTDGDNDTKQSQFSIALA